MLIAMASVVAAGTSFTCTPIAVWDGDGPIICSEEPRINLSGIAAREIDGSCYPGHPCASASGPVARDYLVKLLGGSKGVAPIGHVLVNAEPLQCVSVGLGKGSTTAAWCSSASVGDLSCAMVKSGYVLRMVRSWGDRRCP